MHRCRSHLGAVLCLAAVACRGTDVRPAAAATAPAGEVWLEPSSPKLAYITVEPVGVRRERTIATLPAQVVMNEDRTVRVQSPVTGRIASLDAQPGDYVERGAPLAHIASGDFAQARSDAAKADAALAQLAAALARARACAASLSACCRSLRAITW